MAQQPPSWPPPGSRPPGPPPGWQPPYPPPQARKNRSLLIALATGAAVLLLIVIVAVIANSGGVDADDPQDVAEHFLDAVNSGDIDAAEVDLCDGASLLPSPLQEIIDSEPDLDMVEPIEDPSSHLAGPSTQARLTGTSSRGAVVGGIALAQYEADGPWCVNNFYFVPDDT